MKHVAIDAPKFTSSTASAGPATLFSITCKILRTRIHTAAGARKRIAGISKPFSNVFTTNPCSGLCTLVTRISIFCSTTSSCCAASHS